AVTLAPEQLRRRVSPEGKPIRPVLSHALAQLLLRAGNAAIALDGPESKSVPRHRSAGWFLALPLKAFGSVVLFAGLVVLLPLLLWRRRKPEQKVRYYCQKPWTDLNNFTVDGRMDVCCIATGASQEKYALGNILTQRFQDIWNGPMMREFRRTVNGTKPLPPCQRCPMAFSYQGPLFSPTETRALLHGRADRLRLTPLVRLARWLADMFMDRLLFRGFHK
ncbi:MAG TPA: SPASM domain-containing protein, partial [Gemmataceae bacterium]|nr:SPASM domain-containing protein [Gemmataceae bacterium]